MLEGGKGQLGRERSESARAGEWQLGSQCSSNPPSHSISSCQPYYVLQPYSSQPCSLILVLDPISDYPLSSAPTYAPSQALRSPPGLSVSSYRECQRGKYHCTIDLQFDWFGISCMTTDNFCFYLQNRLIQTGQTGGQWYTDTSPLVFPALA